MYRILFTSVGRRVELIQAFKNAAQSENVDLELWGGDMSDDAPALCYCDRRIQLCRINAQEYIPQLLHTCSKYNIDMLIPTIDTDLLLLADNKKKFNDIGTKVLIGEKDKIAFCRDKRYTADFFVKCGLHSPIPVDNINQYKGRFPCFIKPKDGSSSINAFKVNDENELKLYSQKIKDYIIQPFIDGDEYTIDIFCDYEGNPVYITPRSRLAVRSGEVLKTQIENNDEMIKESFSIIEKFKPCGPITVQLIKEKLTGINYYIEINPRYGGGAPLSIKAGADSPRIILKMLQGKAIKYEDKAAKNGKIYSRFDQSVCTNIRKKEILEIYEITNATKLVNDVNAVVFDLDDTLYSEKDYVRCGYRKVAAEFTEINNMESKLWAAFTEGKHAIDYVLRQEGMLNEQNRLKCIQVYRENKPDISLYDGVLEMICSFKKNGKKIGIITDGRPQGQRNKLQALELYDIVDEIIITDELAGNSNPVKFRKPCDIAFKIMQKRLGIPFSKMVYIGDNLSKDFEAPQVLGIKSIHFKNADGLYNE